MLPESPQFLIRGEDGLEYGPVSLEELRHWVQENRAGLGTDVRRDEPNADWKPWQNYPELIALLAEVQVTSPIPGQPGLALAPLGRRVLAFGLDLMLTYILFIPIMITLMFAFLPEWLAQCVIASGHPPYTPPELSLEAKALLQGTYDLILALYFAGFIAAHGTTPAKSILRLRVVDQDGRKPALTRIILRALVLILSTTFFFLPLTYAFFNPQRRALHDYIAGTYVVEA